MILSELAPLVSAQHGVFYTLASLDDGGEPVLRYQAGYGYKERKQLASHFRLGEGLVGQCAQEKERILLTDVPGDYVRINSGLGESPPLNIIVLPILFEGSVRAVVELASFSHFSPTHQAFLDQLTETIGLVLNTIEANTLTENLLTQAQSQAQELQARQEELRSSNEDLGTQAKRLAEQNIEVERKNQEVELAKRLVEEKAEQLAVSSQYKSEFFSNMSHELRTPLNSLLILAGELEDNPEHNLTTDSGGVRQRDSLLRQRPAAAAQRHPRPREGRVRNGRAADQRPAADRAPGCPRTRLRAHRRTAGPVVLGRACARSARGHRHRPGPSAPGAEEPPRQRLQVHRER